MFIRENEKGIIGDARNTDVELFSTDGITLLYRWAFFLILRISDV